MISKYSAPWGQWSSRNLQPLQPNGCRFTPVAVNHPHRDHLEMVGAFCTFPHFTWQYWSRKWRLNDESVDGMGPTWSIPYQKNSSAAPDRSQGHLYRCGSSRAPAWQRRRRQVRWWSLLNHTALQSNHHRFAHIYPRVTKHGNGKCPFPFKIPLEEIFQCHIQYIIVPLQKSPACIICLSKWPSLSTDLIYWADVVSYPRHPEVTPSQSYWHTDGQSGLIQKQQHKQQQQQQQTKQQTIAKPFQNLSGLGFDWLQF